MSDYLPELRKAINAVHGCDAAPVETVPVNEVFRGQTAWEGNDEVFNVAGHAKATRCYAWSDQEHGAGEIAAVLKLPPVVSPETAVKVAAAAHSRKAPQC